MPVTGQDTAMTVGGPRQYRYLFGPVPSRRFGRSLGIDLTPHKTCSLDCIFCQLGLTTRLTHERHEYVPTAAVETEIDHWLARREPADYLTLAGSGEPTLHSEFGRVLRFMRERSSIPTVLLTNGTLLHEPDVRAQAAQASIVKLTLCSWNEQSFAQIHRPSPGITLAQLVAGAGRFRREFTGQIWLEVLLLHGINADPEQVKQIAALARQLDPDRVQLHTCTRPPALASALPVPPETLRQRATLFSPPAEVIGAACPDRGARTGKGAAEIVELLQRRPCTAEQIATAFALHLNEVAKHLEHLTQTGQISPARQGQLVFYRSTSNTPKERAT